MVGELLQMGLLLGDLLLHLQKLLLLALADGVVLGGLFALLEGVARERGMVSLEFLHCMRMGGGSFGHAGSGWRRACGEVPLPGELPAVQAGGSWTYPGPPILGGAPVSPADMTRVVVVKAARDARATGRLAVALVTAVRSIVVM